MPRLSVCILTKNAADTLPRAIRSVQGLADEFPLEIIVGDDTLSTDNTAEIAQILGARVLKIVWHDSFAAARNDILDQARGDWVFWLDADEELLPESIPDLRGCITQPIVLAFDICRQDLYDETHPDRFTVMWQTRLFRRLPALRFSHRIHESVDGLESIAASMGMTLARSNITLRHTGYLDRLRHAKHARNIPILEKQLADHPADHRADHPASVYYLVEYGKSLLELGNPHGHTPLRQAAEIMSEAERTGVAPQAAFAPLLEYVLRFPDSVWPAARAEAASLQWFPNSPPLLWLLARARFERSDFAGAARLLERLVTLAGDHTRYERAVSFDPQLLGHRPRLNLGAAYLRLGELDKAERCFLAVTREPGPLAEAARKNLTTLHALRQQFPRKS